jgi:hypothetical protein
MPDADGVARLTIDVNDFTAWTPETWDLLDWSSIAFPQDPAINICTVSSYIAVDMILWYQPAFRAKQKRIWDELNFAWAATFAIDLTAAGLERRPKSGPHAFNKAQFKWLFETLRFLKQSTGRPR